jgi:hypothetical protein
VERDAISSAAAVLGRKGGQAGRGESKRRAHTTPEHMRALRAAPRMRLTVAASGHVTISYQGPDGLRRERTFSANSDTPVYVREHRHDGTTTQPCEQLASTGSTLRASRATLADVIRREYRAMRAAEKRYGAR